MDCKARINEFQVQLQEKGIVGAFVSRRGGMAFFTNSFIPWRSALYIPAQGDDIELITLDVDIVRVKQDYEQENVRLWRFGSKKTNCDCIIDVIKERNIGREKVGFELAAGENVGVLSATEYLQITGEYPELQIENIMPIVDAMMVPKTKEELDLLYRAAEAADMGMKMALEKIEVGISEVELAGWAELGARKGGHQFNWCTTGTEVGSGLHNKVHFTCRPNTKKIQHGDLVTIDIHTMYELYISDFCMNVVMGQPTTEQKIICFP